MTRPPEFNPNDAVKFVSLSKHGYSTQIEYTSATSTWDINVYRYNRHGGIEAKLTMARVGSSQQALQLHNEVTAALNDHFHKQALRADPETTP